MLFIFTFSEVLGLALSHVRTLARSRPPSVASSGGGEMGWTHACNTRKSQECLEGPRTVREVELSNGVPSKPSFKLRSLALCRDTAMRDNSFLKTENHRARCRASASVFISVGCSREGTSMDKLLFAHSDASRIIEIWEILKLRKLSSKIRDLSHESSSEMREEMFRSMEITAVDIDY